MFKCDKCRRITEPGEAMTRVVVETRHRDYHNADGVLVGTGYETVREEQRCGRCKED